MTHEEYDSLIVSEQMSVGYISDMENYELYHLTKGGMELYGIDTPDEYIGKKCYEVLQGLDQPCSFCNHKKLKEQGKCRWEYYNNKLERWMISEASVLEINQRLCRIEHAYDISAQKKELSKLHFKLTREEVLVRCIHLLAGGRNLDVAVNGFLEQIGLFYGANRAYIFEIDYESQTVNNSYEWCAEGVSREIESLQGISLQHISRWIEKFKETGEFFITSRKDELDHDTEEYRLLKQQNIQSLLASSIQKDGQIVGFIGVDDPSECTQDFTLLRAAAVFITEEFEKRYLIAELKQASFVDLLTGVSNRNQYIHVLKQYDIVKPNSLGVIFIDINGMKQLNDTYGHEYGDYVLIQVAKILKKQMFTRIFRIGGDEFVVLLENLTKKAFEEKVSALRFAFKEHPDCEASMGAMWGQENYEVKELIFQADELMYTEKQKYYKSVLSTGHPARMGIAGDVIKDIAEGRFVVYFQPQVNINTREVVGAEALIRKKGEDDKLIPPDRFVPHYEMEGIICHVDLFVLDTACQVLHKWQKEGRNLQISVNFSRVTLMEEGIVDKVMEICSQNQVSPNKITIEVTESTSKMTHERLGNLVNEIQKAGFTVSLDDFGSKYSNLSILTSVAFQEVKFDKSLMDGLEKNRNSRVLMRNGIHMCQELGTAHSLAEGIETEKQLALLKKYHCDYGQGYLFSKPITLEELNRVLDKGRL